MTLTFGRVRIWSGIALLLSLLSATESAALTGVVLDSRTQLPIRNAEVTIAGQRGSIRTGVDGGFDWAIAVVFPDRGHRDPARRQSRASGASRGRRWERSREDSR